MNLDNDTISGLLRTIVDQKEQLERQDKSLGELYEALKQDAAIVLLDDCLGAMQCYQKASGADRADWDFSDEIKQIEDLLNER